MILEEFDLEKQLRLVKKGERISIAQNAFAMGLSVEQVASLCAEQADIVQKWFDEWIIAENPSPNSSNIN